jgi:hypothetical protein
MGTTITCPRCGTEFEISDAIYKEIESTLVKDIEEKHNNQLKDLESQHKKALEEEKEKIRASAQKEATDKLQKDFELKLKAKEEEAQEEEKKYKASQEELIETTKKLREAKDAEIKLKLEYEKKLLDEQEQIKAEARKAAEDEMELQIAQQNKKLSDAEKQIRELQKKIQQGSQQTQGEILEIAIEEQLKQSFPYDEIKEVPKGIRGADVIQVVKTQIGKPCGTIVWETKNTKKWSDSWIGKIVDDQRSLKADIAVIVSVALPNDINSFGQREKVWISDRYSATALAHALRQQLIGIKTAKDLSQGMATKAEVVYNYLTSNEFRHRIEVWVEYFKERHKEINKERAYFNKKWEKEIKEIQKVFDSTAGMYGDLQGLLGSALPKVKYLELPDNIEEDL